MNGTKHPYYGLIAITAVVTTLVLSIFAQPARAATYTVTSSGDSGTGTLREAVGFANASATDDVIDFAIGGVITLTSGEIAIANNGSLTIDGSGHTVVIDGDSASRVFNIASNAVVTFNRLTITNGLAPTGENGGGILAGGPLTINRSTISGNQADGNGGGVYADQNLTIADSTFSSNTAAGDGGGFHVDINSMTTITGSTFTGNTAGRGAGFNVTSGSTSSVYVTNSTLFNNTATALGGGARLTGGAAMTILNSTISNNNAPAASGGGLRIVGSLSTIILYNTIVANNSGDDCNPAGGTVSAQNSLVKDGSCSVTGGTNGNLNGDPNLNASLMGSPGYLTFAGASIAIDAGDNTLAAGLVLDQAGYARIADGAVDMGSFESNSVPVLTISLDTASIEEGESASFTISRTGSTTSSLTALLRLTRSSDMTNGDYTMSGDLGSSITPNLDTFFGFPANVSSLVVTFNATDDVPAEPDNTLTIRLLGQSSYVIDNASETVTIIQNDLVVTNTDDSGEGSLRQAVLNANAFTTDDIITFTTTGLITLTSGQLSLADNGSVTINGGGHDIIVSGNNANRIFDVEFGARATLDDLTITDGREDNGGGIRSQGWLTINNSTVTNNETTSGNGGGIQNIRNTLTITNSTISNNTAFLSGGGIRGAAGTSIDITDSIIANNSDAGTGGAIFLNSTTPGSISSSCITNNSDTAINTTGSTLTATGNWWGSSWGPYIAAAPAGTGSRVSTGDSISDAGTSSSEVDVGIVNIPADYGDYQTPPTGNWLTTAPAGCAVCTEVSNAFHAARACN